MKWTHLLTETNKHTIKDNIVLSNVHLKVGYEVKHNSLASLGEEDLGGSGYFV